MKINKNQILKINKSLHRDIGYFFVFLVLIYSVSGIAINHADDWNPDYYVRKNEFKINLPQNTELLNESIIKKELIRIGELDGYLMYDSPTSDKVKIYFKNGSIMCNLNTGKAELERVTKRYLLFTMNYLHRNPGGIWTIFADIFSIGLILISITGLFVARGSNSLSKRGKWFVASGVAVTFLFIFLISF